ncbi:MAG: endonuclease/exonuclease/phosphatase family protein [Bacteroidaceae bacterium]|nr:endonuclease/exonuclease/phosphatase family protein [Bacteroidaceae bacterium]
MKNLFLTTILALTTLTALAQELTVGTYNIRNRNDSDSLRGDVWTRRCRVMCDQLNWENPDVFGTQEVLHRQLLDMLQNLDGYDYIGVGRDDGKQDGEYAAIFYKKDRVRLLESGNFWLNETPDRPALGWDAACIRICTWGRFLDLRSGKEFLFLNLHMDHVGKVARREAAKLVSQRIQQMAEGKRLTILTGDFNVDQRNEIYSIFTQSGLLKDCYEATRLRFAENGTFNDFDAASHTIYRIDHIFVTAAANVDAYAVRTDSYWTQNADGTTTRRTPSDHYPVFARIRF